MKEIYCLIYGTHVLLNSFMIAWQSCLLYFKHESNFQEELYEEIQRSQLNLWTHIYEGLPTSLFFYTFFVNPFYLFIYSMWLSHHESWSHSFTLLLICPLPLKPTPKQNKIQEKKKKEKKIKK